jgi:hypothetical protein
MKGYFSNIIFLFTIIHHQHSQMKCGQEKKKVRTKIPKRKGKKEAIP